MLLPLMGLFMFFIPVGGLVLGVVFSCIKCLRPLSPFAFILPFCGSYAAIAGFWGTALLLEYLGSPEWLVGIGGLFGFVLGGLMGIAVGFLAVRWTLRKVRELRKTQR